MLAKRDTFFNGDNIGLGICGFYVPTRDAVHVGIFINWENEQKVVHLNGTNIILIQDALEPYFSPYYFHMLKDFPSELIDSLWALSELVAQNRVNNLRLNLNGIVYNGATFNITNGSYVSSYDAENFINCAVFVLAILETYDYHILDWATWPIVGQGQNTQSLNDWFNLNNIAPEERDRYYKVNKDIRGKHVFVTPLAANRPATYNELEALFPNILDAMRNNVDVIQN